MFSVEEPNRFVHVLELSQDRELRIEFSDFAFDREERREGRIVAFVGDPFQVEDASPGVGWTRRRGRAGILDQGIHDATE